MSRATLLIITLILLSCKGNNKNSETFIVQIKNPKLYCVSDTLKYSDLEVIYNDNQKDNYFSSADSIFSRRYIGKDSVIKISLTISDKKKVLEILKEYDFFSLPNKLEEGSTDGSYSCVTPSFSTQITLRIGNNKKSVFYSGFCPIKDKQIEYRFNNIDKMLRDLIFNKKEIKEMKETNMIYM